MHFEAPPGLGTEWIDEADGVSNDAPPPVESPPDLDDDNIVENETPPPPPSPPAPSPPGLALDGDQDTLQPSSPAPPPPPEDDITMPVPYEDNEIDSRSKKRPMSPNNGAITGSKKLKRQSKKSPEHLRRVMAEHADLGSKRANNDRLSYLGALKYIPLAIFKLLENMPQPWESEKMVKALYHESGAVTFIDEIPNVNPSVYTARWAAMWTAMRQEKRDRQRIRRMQFPPFDDEEPPILYEDNFEGVEAPAPVLLHDESLNWLFENKYKSMNMTWETLAKLKSIAEPLAGPQIERYCLDLDSLETAKSLGISVSGGPRFEPEFTDADPDEEAVCELNSIDRIVFRQKRPIECKVALPDFYNNRPRRIRTPKFQQPLLMEGRINAIKPSYSLKIKPCQDLLPNLEQVKPLLADFDLNQREWKTIRSSQTGAYPFSDLKAGEKRAEDVPLVKSWYNKRPFRGQPVKTRISCQRLLKKDVKNNLKLLKQKRPSPKRKEVLQTLKKTGFFREAEVDWLEAGLQLVKQGYSILELLIHRKGLTFLHLDYNFNLKPTKTLTTKERKRSRFGHSFNIVRELLKIVKLVVDAHVQFRLGNVDAYELADGLHFLFNHIGQLTGIYRYKYKVMHQIKACKDLKHVLYKRFNVGIGKGPGNGFWQPSWRVWLSFIRGMLPLLESWLTNLLVRQTQGRKPAGPTHKVTKQRIESHYDLELRQSVLKDILDLMPENLRDKNSKVILQHLSEAWRCWKADIPWEVEGMPPQITEMITRYIRAKADFWIAVAHRNRERLKRGLITDKAILKKNSGRLARLWMKSEQERQLSYADAGTLLSPEEGVSLFKTVAFWLEERSFAKIEFPSMSYKHDNLILTLALEALRENYSMAARLNQTQRDELTLIENAYDNPHETLSRIKKSLLTQRVFKEVNVSLMDFYSHVTPIYDVDAMEKITDAYLDQYLWYEASRKGLFPAWVKPCDDEVAPHLVHKWCSGINNLKDIWNTENGESTVHVQVTLEDLAENIDLLLLNRLLRLIVDASIADYICARMNVVLSYKDMSHIHRLGLLKGIQFSGFVFQFYGLMVDLSILGIPRALDLAGDVDEPNKFLKFKNQNVETDHPIRAYCRYFDQVHIVYRLTSDESQQEIYEYLDKTADVDVDNIYKYGINKTWPRDLRFRHMHHDVNLGRAIFINIAGSVPKGVAKINWARSNISVYGVENPALLLSMCGFEVRIAPFVRGAVGVSDDDAVWYLSDSRTQERTAKAQLRVCVEEVERFNHRIKQILMSSGATAFTKIVNRWNTALTGFVTYFREAATSTPMLLDTLVKCETRIQNKVKMGLNSKMPTRFPPCVFYSPKEIGGLGMYSASHILIPESDLRWSKQTDSGVTHFRTGITHEDEHQIPNIFRYVASWESEILESERVWAEYAQRREIAEANNERITLEDLEECWDRGLPRINTLFQRDRQTLAYDKGFRVRLDFKQYSSPKYNSFWWINNRHDGSLWNLSSYRQDVIEALGGVQTILEHTIFKGTGFDNWEGLFWESASSFENSMQFRKLTNAQRSGLSQIPNRRFTLWWSPTINRADVYVGYLVQLDLTGIFLHGKIPTLKISYIQVFRAHLWQKIHESLIMDAAQVFDKEMDVLQIDSVEKLPIHPRKSYRMTSSTADLLLTSSFRWSVSKPSSIHDTNDRMDFGSSNKFWIDLQLRYGDYDSHDITRYAKAKFLDYTTDGISEYPSTTGLIICVDLAYNCYSAYGNWFSGLKPLVTLAMNKMMKANPALFVLRERIRQALQLFQHKSTAALLTSANFNELFGRENTFFVDDSVVYRSRPHKTIEGNMTTKPMNGAGLTIDPRSGKLYLQVVHVSTWAGQKRLGALSKWKFAEDIGNLLHTIPKPELPKQLVITSKGLKDPLDVHMLDFPNILVRPSELNLPFKALLQLKKIGELVEHATESKLVMFNLYDDWLVSGLVEPFTAFSRLVLLLRGFILNSDKARAILKPTNNVITEQNHFWPTLTSEQWIQVENGLSDLILDDYGRKHNVNVNALTQQEIRDLILGQKIVDPSEDRQREIAEIEAKREETKVSALKTKGHTRHGEEITVFTTSNYEQQKFQSQSSWRQRLIASTNLVARNKNVVAHSSELQDDRMTYVFPTDILQKLVIISDTRVQVAALIYGRVLEENPQITEIVALAFLPQVGNNNGFQLPKDLPDSEGLSELLDMPLTLLGLLHTQTTEDDAISPIDLTRHASELDWSSDKLVATVNIASASPQLMIWRPTSQGIEWGQSNKDLVSREPLGWSSSFATMEQVVLSKAIKGCYFVPRDDVWNFSYVGASWNPRLRCFLKIGVPLKFHDEAHRPLHFRAFETLTLNDHDYEDPFL